MGKDKKHGRKKHKRAGKKHVDEAKLAPAEAAAAKAAKRARKALSIAAPPLSPEPPPPKPKAKPPVPRPRAKFSTAKPAPKKPRPKPRASQPQAAPPAAPAKRKPARPVPPEAKAKANPFADVLAGFQPTTVDEGFLLRPADGPGLALEPAAGAVLVTGFPNFVARRMIRELAEQGGQKHIYFLAQEKFAARAQEFIQELLPHARCGLSAIQGNVTDMHLGLSSDEYGGLMDELTYIYHLAAVSYLGVSAEVMRQVNVQGTRTVLELAADCGHLKRLVHFSTVFVSGDRTGVIREDELESGQGFRNPFEETQYQAERLVREAMNRMPISVMRPSIIIGDSKTGEIDRFDGPYYMAIILVTSPVAIPLPLPRDCMAPFNVVPVDFVVKAAIALAQQAETVGRTFHLVDPAPIAARTAYEIIARASGRKLPRMMLSARITKALLRLPGISKLAQAPLQAIDYANHVAIYNCNLTLRYLEGTGIICPGFDTYAENLTAFVRSFYRNKRRRGDSMELADVRTSSPMEPHLDDGEVKAGTGGAAAQAV